MKDYSFSNNNKINEENAVRKEDVMFSETNENAKENNDMIKALITKYNLRYVFPSVTAANVQWLQTPAGIKPMTKHLSIFYRWCSDGGHSFLMIPINCLENAITEKNIEDYLCPVNYSYVVSHGYYLYNRTIPVTDCIEDEFLGLMCEDTDDVLDWTDAIPPIYQRRTI